MSSVLLAAGGLPPLVQDLSICLAAAVAFAVVCEYVRLPHALGFIVAGVVIGPFGLEFVQQPEDVRVLADLGIVLLLFLLGVELDFAALARRKRVLLIAGSLQVPITVGVATLALLAGLTFLAPQDFTSLAYLAMACAFSSTLLVVRALEERRQMSTVFGALCIGLLLAQDLWALIILAVQPSASADPGALLAPVVGTALVALVAVGLGRRVLVTVVEKFRDSPEFLGLMAVGWCLACALVAGNLEAFAVSSGSPVALSSGAGMGAFAAGVTIASVPRARELVHRLVGLRDFFVVFFFVSLGMAIPWPIDAASLLVAGALVGAMVLGRAAVMYPLLRLGGTDRRQSAAVTSQMTQVSEFALVIVYLGHELGHIGVEIVTVVVLAFVGTSALTPVFGAVASRLRRPEPNATHRQSRWRRLALLRGVGRYEESSSPCPSRHNARTPSTTTTTTSHEPVRARQQGALTSPRRDVSRTRPAVLP